MNLEIKPGQFISETKERFSQLPHDQRAYYVSLGILVTAQIADILTTTIGLQLPNISEGNLYQMILLEKFGPLGVVPLKVGGTLLIYGVAERLRNINKDGYRASVKALRPTNIFLTSVALYNLVTIYSAYSQIP